MKTYQVDKIKLIGDKLKEILQNYLLNVNNSKKFTEIFHYYEELPLDLEIRKFTKDSFILPIEVPREYPLKPKISNAREAREFLEGNDIAIGSFDSSFYIVGPHLMANIGIITTAAWFQNYKSGDYGNIIRVFGAMDIGDSIDFQILIKKYENEVIRELINKLRGKHRIILFDESFNCAYTLSWAFNKRKEMVERVLSNINACVDNDIVPVAVFYTRSRDLLRGISIYKGKNLDSSLGITDASFFSKYLKNKYARSTLFKVYSRPLAGENAELLTFYIRVNGSIVRVEFPREFESMINLVHGAIISQIILGNGFPIAMERAHELAVIKKEDREIIEHLIAKYLGKPGIEYVLSRKELSKRRPVS